MAPIGSFSPRDVNFYNELVPTVNKALSKRRILRRAAGEDEQTIEQYIVYAIGRDKSSAEAFVLIGNSASRASSVRNLGKDIRPHLLIGSADIINDVKAEISNMRLNPQQQQSQ
ncbi:MAG: hypothetical protein HY427_01855 [Candidatus Levybacteria bacterium]|nr:hypothetical protein [Candidatus Levybacteria bacterium]